MNQTTISRSDILVYPKKGAICIVVDGTLYEKPMSADELEYLALRVFLSMRETRHDN